MRHFLIITIVIALSNIFAQAQSTGNQDESQSLIQRVDSLEHELSYLKLTYELSTLNSDIIMFSNEVYTKSISIQLDLYNQNFDRRLGEAYKRYYESCLHRQESFSELIEAKQTFFAVKVLTYPYTELELNTLMASYNVIKDAYNSLESSMNLLKLSIETYQKYM